LKKHEKYRHCRFVKIWKNAFTQYKKYNKNYVVLVIFFPTLAFITLVFDSQWSNKSLNNANKITYKIKLSEFAFKKTIMDLLAM